MASSSSSSSSLPLPSTDHQNQYTYEVFLSFRGEDTRCNFTDHLYAALDRRGITTFRDDEGLNRGEDISQELLKAIEESRVSIIVFSPNYASSRWCLDELVKILDCRRSKGQKVRSVFYKVDPSDVRKQTGAFGDGFAKLDQYKYEDKICKWRKALEEAADLSGWPYKDGESEVKFIDDIVGELSARVVNPSCTLHVAAHPVGLESCRKDVNRLLDLEKNVVCMVGIWGAGGIGKTTIAKEVFNSIRHKFEGCCFLANVRSNSNGLAQLQETLLSRILGDSNLKISSVDEGVGLIKIKMQRKKVLIILDDVSHSSQLEKLVPSHDCLGRGSRILITTRDKGCLRDADEKYEVKILNDCHAMKLFSLTAFREIEPPSDHLELAQRVIRYAQGLPLALILLGSHLFRRSREEWEDIIGSCRGEPHTRIQDILRLSYDGLSTDNLKEVFLDIACFFKGKSIEKVKPILQACYDLKSGIEQLQEKALLRIDRDEIWEKDRIWMHDLIEEMGKKIANPEGKPGESTRLWNYDDVKRALTDNTGTKKIKGIHLARQYNVKKEICLNAKSFSKMKNLRYFYSSYDIKWSGNIDYLSNELRWLKWSGCPLQWFPSNFHLQKLVMLNIFNDSITRLWDGRKNLPNLKYMKLSCQSLTELPDLSGIPNLIALRLSDCYSLAEIHDSVGSLDKLEILNLKGCNRLQEFPKITGKTYSLMRELNLSYSGVKELDPSIGNLSGLKELRLEGCKHLTTLPCSIYDLRNLENLYVTGCNRLREIPELPPNILEVYASYCESLEGFSMLPKSLNTVEMNLRNCNRFSECLGNDMKMMENILLKNQESRFSLVFPCQVVPKWFQYCSKEVIATEYGSTCAISFEIPSKLNLENIAGVAAICSSRFEQVWPLNLRADLYINGVHIHQRHFNSHFDSDHMWLTYIPLSGEIKGKLLGVVKCRVEFKSSLEMKSCGVHLVCQSPDEPEGKRPHTGANDNYHYQQEQQEQPIVMSPSKRHCTEDE